MIDADDLVQGVLRGVMGGRRKRSKKALRYLGRGSRGVLSNPNALLTVAGLAWGVFETLQNSSAPGAAAPAGAASPAPGAPGLQIPPPLPSVPTGDAVPPDALRLVRLAIAAANADGAMTEQDRAAVLEQARAAGAEHLVEMELQQPRPLAEIAAGVTDPARAATLYVLAFTVARGDEAVSGAERIFLAQLAAHLRLDPETVKTLEAGASTRIDSQD
jgi:uncharacterized membrane protein YebE (DUF533 family)